MTVRELIKRLKDEDPDAQVAFASFDLDEDMVDGDVAYLAELEDGTIVLRG